MSSEEKDTHCEKDSIYTEHDQNDACSADSSENNRESEDDGEEKLIADGSCIQMKLPKKERNIASIPHPSGSNLFVREERSSISEEDSSENLEGLDWSYSGSRDGSSQSQSQRPKTVSFHTGSSLPVERKISNGKLELLIILK